MRTTFANREITKARGSVTLLRVSSWRSSLSAVVRSGKLSWMYAELLHARKQGRAIDAEACGCAIVTSNTSLAFRKCSDDLFALTSGLLVSNAFLVVERVKSFFHYSRNVVPILARRRLRRLGHASSA